MNNQFEYKGKNYTLIADEVMLKHPVTREFLPAVLYKNQEGLMFCRLKSEFLAKFKKVNNLTGV